jgi:hypothetical protein
MSTVLGLQTEETALGLVTEGEVALYLQHQHVKENDEVEEELHLENRRAAAISPSCLHCLRDKQAARVSEPVEAWRWRGAGLSQ